MFMNSSSCHSTFFYSNIMICGYFDNTQNELTKFKVSRLARKNKRQVSDMQDIAVPSSKRIIFIMFQTFIILYSNESKVHLTLTVSVEFNMKFLKYTKQTIYCRMLWKSFSGRKLLKSLDSYSLFLINHFSFWCSFLHVRIHLSRRYKTQFIYIFRQVLTEQGLEKPKEMNVLFMKTSAKDGHNVKEVRHIWIPSTKIPPQYFALIKVYFCSYFSYL